MHDFGLQSVILAWTLLLNLDIQSGVVVTYAITGGTWNIATSAGCVSDLPEA